MTNIYSRIGYKEQAIVVIVNLQFQELCLLLAHDLCLRPIFEKVNENSM